MIKIKIINFINIIHQLLIETNIQYDHKDAGLLLNQLN